MDLDKLENLPRIEHMRNPRNKRTKNPNKRIKKYEEHIPSELENEIAAYLAILGIEYVREKTFPDLENGDGGALLPLDFWLPSYRSVIEIDGVHHRRKVRGDKAHSLDVRKLNDQLRNLFCLQRGFKLLRIRSDRMDNFKQMIDEFLKKSRTDGQSDNGTGN